MATPLTLVIDPAHGGDDRGGVSAQGVEEKTLTLQIALKLKEALSQESEIVVVMTREQDVAMTLDQRAAVANQAKAHLVIGVHVNHAPAPSLAGPSVRVYRAGGSRRPSSGNVLLWTSAQGPFTGKSRSAGTGWLEPLGGGPVREGPWADLRSVAAPAFAFEAGNLYREDEVKWLQSPEGLTRLAENAVKAFRAMRERLSP